MTGLRRNIAVATLGNHLAPVQPVLPVPRQSSYRFHVDRSNRLGVMAADHLSHGTEPGFDLLGPPDIRPTVIGLLEGPAAWQAALAQRDVLSLFLDGGLTWDVVMALAARLPVCPIGRIATSRRSRFLAAIGEGSRTLVWSAVTCGYLDDLVADSLTYPSGHDVAVALLGEGWKQRLVVTDFDQLRIAQVEADRLNAVRYQGKSAWKPVIRSDGISGAALEVPGRLVELPWSIIDAKRDCAADHPYRMLSQSVKVNKDLK